MPISGAANADVDAIAKDNALARVGSGSRNNVAGFLNFTYKAKTTTPSDVGAHTLRLTIANQEGLVTVDWGDGTTTQVGANAGATIDHIYAAAGTKTYDITSSGYHKRGTQVIA